MMIALNVRKNESGMALIYAMWSLAILSSIIVSYIYYMTIELRLGYRYMDTVKARFIAHAGLERAVGSIKGDWTSRDRATLALSAVSGPATIADNFDGTDIIDYVGFYDWIGRQYGDGAGEQWSNIGVWDGTSNTYRETFHLDHNRKFYVPSNINSFSADDIGYYIVAIEDESGKINLNNIPGVDATHKTKSFQRGSFGAGTITAPSGMHFHTVQSAGRATGIGYVTAYENRSHWTVFTDGKINVNSANANVLAGIPIAGGSQVMDDVASAVTNILNVRQTRPITDAADLNAIIGNTVDEAWVRYNSNGIYRIIALGAVVASDGATEMDERAMARMEVYVSRRNLYDTRPVAAGDYQWGMKIISWREIWTIP